MSERLKIENIRKVFNPGTINEKVALDGVDLTLEEGEFVTVIGGNGAGKSTTLNAVAGVWPVDSGKIYIGGEDVTKLSEHRRAQYLGRVFQDPMTGTATTMSIEENMAIAARRGKSRGLRWGITKAEREKYREMLSTLHLGLEDRLTSKVGLLSGGQRQRVGIARALAVNPQFIVCDEPISALDVSIQAQVVNMFEELQEQMGLTYLFIAHDLSVVKHISDRIGVMYLGKMVELADSYELVARSLHPYTKSLISAIPIADPIKARASKRIVLQGDVPSPLNPPTGCRFRTRCPYADECCAQKEPEWREVEKGHYVACHHVEKINA